VSARGGSVADVDTAELRAAYAEFIAEAEKGGFGPAPPNAWGAEQVVAHIARNDEELIAVTAAVTAGQQPSYYNHDAIDDAELGTYIGSMGDFRALVAAVRSNGERLCDLVERLPDDLPVEVPISVRDGARQVVDGPVPWATVLTIQARRHLPAHTQQLRELRD
jgi:hypothetical protein